MSGTGDMGDVMTRRSAGSLFSGSAIRNTLAYAAVSAALRARGISEENVDSGALRACRGMMRAARREEVRAERTPRP